MVETIREAFGCAECKRWASKGADSGGCRRRATTDSMRASSTSAALHTPRVAMRANTLSRAIRAACGCRSGRKRLGDCGSTASNAASACESRIEDLPR